MAGRRVSWNRALEVDQDRNGGNDYENDENVSPVLGDEVEFVREVHVLVRCPPRHHPRLPLRDITHLFHGNTSPSNDKTENGPAVPQIRDRIRFRRPVLPSAQNSRKRRQVQPISGPSAARSVLCKTFR